jgi:hypothetical protein
MGNATGGGVGVPEPEPLLHDSINIRHISKQINKRIFINSFFAI